MAIWVARVDPGAVRNTPDVNLLLRRVDLTSAIRTLTQAEFSLQTEREGCVFLDGQPGEKRDLLQIVLERERNRPDDLLPNPDLTESVITSASLVVLGLEALVRMKLISFRVKDRMHLIDLVAIGLVDQTWVAKYPQPIAERLQQVIDNPNA